MEKVWEIKDPDSLLHELKRGRRRTERPEMDEKDPARAYSLSLLFWGGGQLYTDQPVKGILFLVLLFLFAIAGFVSLIFPERLFRYLLDRGMTLSDVFLAGEALLFFVILFWIYNAGDAYHGAARWRQSRFRGIASTSIPFFCSLLLPGWGQFLNGQQLKGSLFSALTVLGLFSLAAVPATLWAWPVLDPGDSRMLIDAILGVCVLFLPLVPLIWLLGSYDALQVSRNDLLKEPLWERIKAANNRRRAQGWVQGVFPGIRRTLLLVLVLAAAFVVVSLSFPKRYYSGWLAETRTRLAAQGMTVVPDILERVQRASAP